jgi:thiamine pyrophosphate-dependent acetolactate synthase large subunit-like protein
VQIEIDSDELNKGFPSLDLAIQGDANLVLKLILDDKTWLKKCDWSEWHAHISLVRKTLEGVDPANIASEGFI